jgi:hypothetical protein
MMDKPIGYTFTLHHSAEFDERHSKVEMRLTLSTLERQIMKAITTHFAPDSPLKHQNYVIFVERREE